MNTKSIIIALVGVLGWACTASADLVGWWRFDEGSGSVAADSSGNGLDAGIEGPIWIEGQSGSALEFNGTDSLVRIPEFTTGQVQTVAMWIKIDTVQTGGKQMFNGNGPPHMNFEAFDGQLRGRVYTGSDNISLLGPEVALGVWTHVAWVWDFTANRAELYIDGESVALGEAANTLEHTSERIIGRHPSATTASFLGAIDEVRIYDHALDLAEIQAAMKGNAALSSTPHPEDKATDVVRDVVLSWKPGEYAVKHTLYLGTTFDDVNDADTANPMAVLVSEGQDANSLDVGRLPFGTTYYWRVDEVNGAPDNTVFTGNVWSFTVEPVAIPVEHITATASGANADMGPEKTIDGSGMNALDQHSALPTDMWLTTIDGSWIQYEFDKAYKLHEMRVWNSNQVIESFIGFGVKEAIIETSLDGDTWTPLGDVAQFARASGLISYEANTAVDLSGIVAKYVKISPQSSHGGLAQSGLSEVRFLALPTDARELVPANARVTEGVDVTLNWRAGREAASHQVNVGTDPDNLALAGTTDESVFITDTLDYGQTYYWQVIEVNEAETPATYASDVLSFTTPASRVVDDFESYSGEEGQEVYMTWWDGYGGDGSLGGSTTGHIDGPFVETSVVYGGKQSMPVTIDNDGDFFDIDGKVSSPTFSEVVRDLDGQDWTTSGVKTLSIMFAGSPGLTGQLYCKINGTKVIYDGDAANLGLGAWQAWNIDLSTVGGNLTNVKELAIGVDGASSGILYIDEIRLYPKIGAFITPVAPDAANLTGHWTFDEGSGAVAADVSGNGNDGNVVNGAWQPGKLGSALSFTGTTHVEIPAKAWASIDTQLTVACWNYAETAPANNVVFGAYLSENAQARIASAHLPWGNGNVYFDTSGTEAGGYDRINKAIQDREYLGAWHHWTFVKNVDTGQQAIYLDGVLWHSGGMTKPMDGAGVTVFHLGAEPALANYYNGLIDDFQLYNSALSQEEILWLAGRTAPVAKPF